MIEQFRGNYRWLSNFTLVKINYKGVEYASTEHAFMSAKSKDPKWKEFCRIEPKPEIVKTESRKIKLISDWETKKVEVMKEVLELKFNQSPFKEQLIATGNEEIQEGNNWKDLFWGVDLITGQGKNILGKLIMEIRKELLTKNQ
jgi:ribA/ribD-fused uncharacterized protein